MPFSGDGNPFLMLQLQMAADVGELQLKNSPSFVLSFEEKGRRSGHPPAALWFLYLMDKALETLDPKVRKPAEFRYKMTEYSDLTKEWLDESFEPTPIYTHYEVYMVHNSPETKAVREAIAYALQQYAADHRYDYDFLDVSAKEGLDRMLRFDRLDLMMAFRIASSVPGEVTRMSLPPKARPPDRPAIVVAAEMAIGLIPIVGNAVAAYEAFTGRDLFGYRLSDEERGVLAACVLLPFVARFVQEDRALYSAARMVKLYGGEEKVWAETIAVSERLSATPNAFARLSAAQRVVLKGQVLERKFVTELSDLLKAIDLAKAGRGTPTVLSKRATDAFAKLVAHDARWLELDANQIERLSRMTSRSKIKGQLFEEMVENDILLWLNDPSGKAALGLAHVEGRLEYIPGHLITDERGLQFTDGMLVVKLTEDDWRVYVVLEAKSGEFAAQGLASRSESFKRMSKANKAELNAEVEDAWQMLQQHARRTGAPVTITRKDVFAELAKGPGQIRTDIERLKQMPTALVGGREVRLQFSVKQSKMYGIVPSDVETRELAKVIRESGITNFVALKSRILQKDLQTAADVLADAFGIPKKKK